MVKGINQFKAHFKDFNDRYVLIGSVACFLSLDEAGLDFRVTKDLDIVLYVEALDVNFAKAFWNFVERGKYKNTQKSTGKKLFYRFYGPELDDGYYDFIHNFKIDIDGIPTIPSY